MSTELGKHDADIDKAKARAEIDRIDRQMAALFEERMAAVELIAAAKRNSGTAVFDAAREQEVLRRNSDLIKKTELRSFYTDFMRHTMSLSSQYQTQLLGRDTVAYQGVEGAFSHITTRALFPHGRLQNYTTWTEVFEAVERGEASAGVLPFENSQAGDVAEVLDLCFAHSCYIRSMVDLPVRQNLLGPRGVELADVRDVYSHPQAISQSARFLNSMHLKAHAMDNTAVAAKFVAEQNDRSKAAIASIQTAELYGLAVLASNINTSGDNTTRFIVIGPEIKPQGDGFSLLITLSNEVGTLAGATKTIANLNLNMDCIKSRPLPNAPWQYYFYIGIRGKTDTETAAKTCSALEKVCSKVRLLGIYDREKIEE